MRSLRSLPFFRPPKAILVPGMNFLGFSRYLNCSEDRISTPLRSSTQSCGLTRESSFQVTPAPLLASV